MRIIYVLLLLSFTLAASDVYLKNGLVITNVKEVRESGKYYVIILADGEEKQVIKEAVERIDDREFVPNEDSRIYNPDKLLINPLDEGKHTYPNLKLLPVSFIAFGMSYAYIRLATKTGKNKIENLSLAAVFTISGITNTIISFKKVKVSTNGQSLGLTYHF